MPPILRTPKFLAWIYVIVKPVQKLWQLVFEDYAVGSAYLDYSNVTTYSLGDKVRWDDKSIYELITSASLGNNPTDTINWVKINDLFIGVNERIKYSAQKLLFEYALNRFFITSGIYIQNNFINASTNFVMSTTSESSSVIPLNSAHQIDYMNLNPVYVTDIYDYTIFVPAVFYASLGVNAEGIVRTFADKYNLAGMQYNVDTF
jgi:hypothetical protein